MKVNSISNNVSMTGFTTSLKQGALNCIPKCSFNSKDNFQKMYEFTQKIVSPENNRLILGATAILTQPFIDMNNKKVDEDTRKFSTARTVAKIIAGTGVGYLVRLSCIKAIEAFSKLPHEITPNMRFAKFRSLFLPKDISLIDSMVTYKKSVGTILGMFVMLFTNFLLDAPITKFLTNRFVSKMHISASKPENDKEVKHE